MLTTFLPTADGQRPPWPLAAEHGTLEAEAANFANAMLPNRPGLKIATIAGIPIYVHPTWLVIFGLITWTLVDEYTHLRPEWTSSEHWVVGLATSALFFASVLFHEMSHSIVAQRYKIRVLSITLFIFGGVARIERDPSKAIQEFNIAVAGPVASFVLSGVFWTLSKFFSHSELLAALTTWLCWINGSLALFNLLPGFPLDGGRIFRAIVWGIT